MVKCIHKGDCTSYPYKCDTCRHNKSKKKDYYEPDNYPWYPYEPYRPYRPYYPTIWCGNDTNSVDITTTMTKPIQRKRRKKRNYYSKV